MANTQRKTLARTSYHVAWICPVADLELLPAVLMLDEEHDPPNIDNHADENIYEFGSAAGHNIVLATCRQGLTGNVNVSSITAPLFKTFPNIRMTLLVGIGGGVPQPDSFSDPLNDLRLGDVVVGWPTSADGRGAVVYYESGRSKVDGFEMTGTMDKPHSVILNALPSLKLHHDLGRSTFHQHMGKLQNHERLGTRFKHPGLEHDRLFHSNYRHVGGYKSNCKDCESHELVERESRKDSQKDLFIYHQGRVATGNSVVMDGEKRDSISLQCGGALCIEMEAAGLEVNSRCLVIRGISDYADSHKSDLWRSYAAAKAVAFARELLGTIPARDIEEKMASGNKHWIVNRSTNPHFTGRREVINRIVKRITSENAVNTPRTFVLTGMGGQGKSEICLHVANEVRDRFWGIFWVDVSTRNAAEDNFSEVAEALGCPKTVDAVRKTLSNLAPTRPWLLILDNADDPHRDYQIYLPSGNRGATLMTSRNPQCGRLAVEDSQEELDRLEESECVELLYKTAQLSSITQDTEDYADAVSLVKHLGHHTLAILHAGSYMATTHCGTAEYFEFLRTNRRRLLERSRGQGQSRYGTVYATFEASMEHLELSKTGAEETRKDALQLLQIFSTLHYQNVPLEVFVDACIGAKKALRAPREFEMFCDRLTAWHVAQAPDLVMSDKVEVRFRITKAVTRLESLALVKVDRSVRFWKFVSMHPLVHSWAGDRHNQQDKRRAFRMTECIVALSHLELDGWNPYHYPFIPHLKLLVESDAELMDDAAQSRCVLQLCVQIAWTYHWSELHADLYEFTSRIFQRLDLDYRQPTEELRELYRVFALGLRSEGSCLAQTLRAFEAIAQLDEKTRSENDNERLYNMSDLGNAFRNNGETKRAVALLEKVVNARQDLDEEHEDLLAAQYDLARALLEDEQTQKAVDLLEKVVRARERLFPAEHPDNQASQLQLGIAYCRNGQIREATPRLEEAARHHAEAHSEEYGREVPTQAWVAYAWLADTHNQAGRLSDAIALSERAVNTLTLVQGSKHPDVLTLQHILGSRYLNAGKALEAIEIYERLVHIKSSTVDDRDHSRLLYQHQLAYAYLEAGRASEAICILERVVEIKRSILEETDRELLVSQKVLGLAYLETGRKWEALSMLEWVAEVESSLHDRCQRDRVSSTEFLEKAYVACGRSFSNMSKASSSASKVAQSEHTLQVVKSSTSDETDGGPHTQVEINRSERPSEILEGALSSNSQELGQWTGRLRTRPSSLLKRGSSCHPYSSTNKKARIIQ